MIYLILIFQLRNSEEKVIKSFDADKNVPLELMG